MSPIKRRFLKQGCDNTQNFYFILWAVLAVYLAIAARRTSALCYAMSAFFVFMSVWYALNSFTELEMFSGILGAVFRCAVGAFLIFLIVTYIVIKRKKKNSSEESDDKGEK